MKILLIGRREGYRTMLSENLKKSGLEILECDDLTLAQKELTIRELDLVICCMPFPGGDSLFSVVSTIKSYAGEIEIIIIDHHIELHIAMQLAHAGVYCCFNRPFCLDQLKETINQLRAPGTGLPPRKKARAGSDAQTGNRYVRGNSEIAQKMYQQIDLIAPTRFNVIVTGETGTGKESVARRIAMLSEASEPFVTVDCGCLSKELAVSELFGHEKGSFTGATEKKTGAFESANNGTLFLDEIANLEYEVQGFLLRAIQEKTIRRLGSTQEIAVNTRLIVATNESLLNAVKSGKFREDLYHRLNEFEIIVPPLRTRPSDIPVFVRHFISEINTELNKNVRMPDEYTLTKLARYNWPGNIRELKNAIRRACLFCRDGMAIDLSTLPNHITEYDPLMQFPGQIPASVTIRTARSVTVDDIKTALSVTRNNKSQAARFLGIDRKTLYNRLQDELNS